MPVSLNTRAISVDTQLVIKELDVLQKSITDPKVRRRIMRKPAQIVVKAARPKIPRSRRVHYRYNTPKIVKSRRARKGYGRKIAAYYPGNLRKSIKRLNFKRTSREFIGPKLVGGGTKGTFGLSATRVDGYYAQMMAGSARQFRTTYMEPALFNNLNRILQEAEKAKDKEIKKIKAKTGL